MRVLVLGGTGEARVLAEALVARGAAVTTSLAGRVARPRLPEGGVRVGGFGGVEPLRAEAATYDAVVDATHPFAATMSEHAAAAVEPDRLLRLQRPGWEPRPGWRLVDGHPEAAVLAAELGARPFLTVGRQSLGDFVAPLAEAAVLARVVDAPQEPLPPPWRLLRDRGPYTLTGERDLMRAHRADVLVTKDSGGPLTAAKLDAAQELDVPVVVVRRPPAPAGVRTVSRVEEVLAWLQR